VLRVPCGRRWSDRPEALDNAHCKLVLRSVNSHATLFSSLTIHRPTAFSTSSTRSGVSLFSTPMSPTLNGMTASPKHFFAEISRSRTDGSSAFSPSSALRIVMRSWNSKNPAHTRSPTSSTASALSRRTRSAAAEAATEASSDSRRRSAAAARRPSVRATRDRSLRATRRNPSGNSFR
jgi:hypothetical protein